jgi:hypothetical protein
MGKIWSSPALPFFVVQLRWQELWHGRSWMPGFFLNKPLPLLLWSFLDLVLCYGARRPPAICPARPPRWWSSEGFKTDESFFNKQPFLWRYDGARQWFFPLDGHGGSERGGDLSVLCGEREERGRSTTTELINVDGFCAAANLRRNSGGISTSNGEALI